MPKRTDIHSILIIGSGPIVIGQGCEFDYSGVQACQALKEEGYRVVLINSNPATIMTDPQFADATYIEPITPEAVEKILAYEKTAGTPVDAVLPTLGGQTGLNVGMACHDKGILARYGVQMIGANREAIMKGEDRQIFKDLMLSIGLDVPRSGVVHTMEEGRKVLADIGLPLIIRPAFTLGGTGGGIAYNVEEFETIVQRGLDASPISEVLIEQSVIGWKEFEMEVMRDKNDNVVIICGIENLDAMGVHTGDSITVAPIQTLSDKEYQRMRDASIAIIRAVGVETGGSNIQFAVNPDNGRMIVVEMNPRVSRSSALASKATGYPIARLAAKLAVGYTLDELPNYITSKKDGKGGWSQHTSACFEPTIDYVVVKIPRWTFEKFPDADETLTTQMKSVGEAMSIGRTFKEALQKGIRSMEVKRFGFGLDAQDKSLNNNGEYPIPDDKLRRKLSVPSQGRLFYVRYALKMGWTIAQVHELTNYDPWFIAQMKELVDFEADLLTAKSKLADLKDFAHPIPGRGAYDEEEIADEIELLRRAKSLGYSDVQLSSVIGLSTFEVRMIRLALGIKPVYKIVDTCAAEFEASTPYYYSSYERPFTEHHPATTLTYSEDEIRLTKTPKVIIIGGGPNRIGQGIEFDYCCVQAAYAMRELGIESVMVNSNPETVSTDYDTSDMLFFEPLTHEDILNICERLNGGAFTGSLVDSTKIGHSMESFADFQPGVIEVVKRELQTRGITRAISALTTLSRDSRRAIPSRGYTFLHDEGSIEFWFSTSSPPQLLEVDSSQGVQAHLASELSPDELATLSLGLKSSGLVHGVIVQYGGQTPLNLAKGLQDAGVPILGTSVASLDAAGDREQFRALLQSLGLKQPSNGIAKNMAEAHTIARQIGYPVLVRPSFVLGGRAMEIVSDESQLEHFMKIAQAAAGENPILIDKFLDNATEVDVDCLADFDAQAAVVQTVGGYAHPMKPGTGRAVIIGVMEHIEEAGIHSGDSACSLPPYSLGKEIVERLKTQTRSLAAALKVRGLMNVQYAIKDGEIYVIEVNPRASRTVPFVGKATGMPWAKIAAKVMAGKSLDELDIHEQPDPRHMSVKEVVFPFSKFPGVDVILGPEMRSTGEVMGIDVDFPTAFAKAQLAAGTVLPTSGTVFLSVATRDKDGAVSVGRSLTAMGFNVVATEGTHKALAAAGIPATRIPKLSEGRPNIRDLIKNGQVQLIINTPTKKGPATDEGKIRALAVTNRVPMLTTMTAALAAVKSIETLQKSGWGVKPLQAYMKR